MDFIRHDKFISWAAACSMVVAACFLQACKQPSVEELSAVTGASDTKTVTKPVVVNGPLGNSALAFAPSFYSFATLATNFGSATKDFTVTNSSTYTIILGTVTGASSQFSLTDNTCTDGLVLEPGATCALTVQFAPTMSGILSTAFSIPYDVTAGTNAFSSNLGVSGAASTLTNFGGLESLSAETPTTIQLNWTDFVGAATYQAYRVSDGVPTLIGTVVSANLVSNPNCGGGSCSFTASGLFPFTSYTFRVRATDSYGVPDLNIRNLTSTTTAGYLALTGAASAFVGFCTPLTVTAQDPDHAPVNVSADTTIGSAGLGSGLIYSDDTCTTSITSPVIPAGRSSSTFYFKDNLPESLTIAASRDLFSTATKSVTVSPKLAFTTQPSASGDTDMALDQAPVVAVKDGNGGTVTSASNPITLTAYSDSACTVPVTGAVTATTNPLSAVSGVAAFSEVIIHKTNAIRIGASAAGLMSACSSPVAVSAVRISSLKPDNGPAAGGTALTIYGSGFVDGTTVSMKADADANAVPCGTVVVLSDTELTCQTSAHAAGPVRLIVAAPYGKSASLANAYSYVAAPAPLKITPSAGPLAGGGTVTIAGTGFRAPAIVLFGGAPCSNVQVLSASSLTCTVLAHTAATVDVSVFNPDLQQGYLANAYSYRHAPVFTSIYPTTGSNRGGTSVGLYGQYFYPGMTVSMGGGSCTNVNVSADGTYLSCTTPATDAVGAVDVTVTNHPDEQSKTLASTAGGHFSYYAPMTVTSVSPDSGDYAGGTRITVTGTSFGSWIPSWGIYLSVPARWPGDYWSQCTNFHLTSPTQFECTTTSPQNAGYIFGGLASLYIYDYRDNSWNKFAGVFTFNGGATPLTVTSIDPPTGSVNGGDQITVTGTGFDASYFPSWGAYFGKDSPGNSPWSQCYNIQIVDSTHFTCTTPNVGSLNVTADMFLYDYRIGWAGPFQNVFSFTGGDEPETVLAVSPSTVPSSGGTQITVEGANFDASRTNQAYLVLDDGPYAGNWIYCENVSVVDGTHFTCTPRSAPPNYTGGTAHITLYEQRNGNWVNSPLKILTLEGTVEPMTIVSITPTNGPMGGGTEITVTGTNFSSANISQVYIEGGNASCNNVNVVSDTTFTCTTSAANTGIVDRPLQFSIVDSRDGSWITLNDAFTYEKCSSSLAGFDGGDGTDGNPYQISTADALALVHANLGCSFKLTSDIDLSGVNFAPIGNQSVFFLGGFDGNGHVVSNWSYTPSDSWLYYQGFFGGIDSSGSVKNLGLVNATLSGQYLMYGGLLVGQNNGNISDSFAMGSVAGVYQMAGGFVGYNQGTISNSFAISDVTGAQYYVGGFVGYNQGTVSNSFALGGVGGYYMVGGFVGYAGGGTISDSFARGSASGSYYVGGFVGYNTSTINYAYAAAAVSGYSYAGGGFSGVNYGSESANFWDTQVSGQSSSPGSGSQDATGETTSAMQTDDSIYVNAGWDFSSTWKMPTATGYPILQAIPPTAILSMSPGGYRFKIAAGTSAPKTFTLKNAGLGSATGISATLSTGFIFTGAGTYPGDGTCSDSLAAGSSCTIGIALSTDAITAGSATGSLSLSFNNGAASKTLQVALSGYIPTCDPNGAPYGGGSGTSDDPYLLCTATQLAEVSSYPSSSYYLFSNIDLGGSATPFNPISSFSGNFDGGGHTISNFYYNNSGRKGVGLFGYTQNATISNLVLDSPDVLGYYNVGSLVGVAVSTTITGVQANSVTVTSSYAGGTGIDQPGTGGLVGEVYTSGASGLISNSSTSGTVSANVNFGGLVGHMTKMPSNGSYGMPIRDSHSSATVIGQSVTSSDSAGGLLGSCHCDDGGKTVISNSSATGNVEANSNVGGLIGTYLGSVENSFATGNVTSHAPSGSGTGGFVAQASDNGSITNCYSTGNVTAMGDGTAASDWTGASYVGTGGFVGIAGARWQPPTPISNSYASGNVTDSISGNTYVGGFVGYNYSGGTFTDTYFFSGSGATDTYATALTAAQMSDQASYAGFDFSTPVWIMPVSPAVGTPYLQWEFGLTVTPGNANNYLAWKPSSIPGTTYTVSRSTTSGSGYTVLATGLTDPNYTDLKALNGTPYYYIVTDSNSNGSVQISGTPAAPPTIAYTGSPFAFMNATAITALTPTLGGGSVSSCTASLPAGLSISARTCVISGSPTAVAAAADYTITASNAGGSATATINITVNPLVCDPTASPFGGGAGSSGNPYLICSSAQLAQVSTSLSSDYQLSSDINLAGVSFAPIGNSSTPYSGTFDGNHFAILNWSYTTTNSGYIGFFGSTSGTVQSLGIENATVSSGQGSIGIMTGWNTGTIQNSYVTGTVYGDSSSSWKMAGFAGYNNGTISKSFAIATIRNSASSSELGGFVGQDQGTITDSFVIGDISGAYASGFANSIWSTFKNSYAAVSGAQSYGFTQYNYWVAPIASFWDTSLSGQSSAGTASYGSASLAGVYGKTTADMQTQSTFTTDLGDAAWDFVNTWKMPDVGGYPILRALPEAAFLMVTPNPADFKAIKVNDTKTMAFTVKNWGFAKATDLSASPAVSGTGFDFAGASYPGTNGTCGDTLASGASCTITITFSPLSAGKVSGSLALVFNNGVKARTLVMPFTGGGVSCDPTNDTQQGSGDEDQPYVFCSPTQLAAASTLSPSGAYYLYSDIDLTGVSMSPIGAGSTPFTGHFDGTGHAVSNWSYTNTTTDQYYPGFFGVISSGATVSNLGIQSAVVDNGTGTPSGRCGILVGTNSGTITNSYVTGTLSGACWLMGGLVGFNTGTISSSFSNATLVNSRSTDGYTSGFVGYNSYPGTISNSFALGHATATSANTYAHVGGFVGVNEAYITNSYAAVSLSGGNYRGGFTGYKYGDESGTFWDTDVSGTSNGYGRLSSNTNRFGGFATGETTNVMQTDDSIYVNAGWDFTTPIWKMPGGGGYPILNWQP